MYQTRKESYLNKGVAFRRCVKVNDDNVSIDRLHYPKCGEIWKCNLGENKESVQGGYRPIFILSNNKNNQHSPNVNVLPITSKMTKKAIPVHVELLDFEKYGLGSPSIILTEQLTTVSMSRLSKKVGGISDVDTLQRIFAAMSIQFPIIQRFVYSDRMIE